MTDRAALTALITDYINAVQNGDVKRFDEILADEFYTSNPDGSLVDRKGFLAQTAKPVTIKGLTADQVMIRLFSLTHDLDRKPDSTFRDHAHGDIAIIHGRTTYSTAEGRLAHGRYTDVWHKRGGQWLAVSAHVTRG